MPLQSDNTEDMEVKIYLACQNVFLSLAFGFYLKEYLSNIDEADFIITDNEKLKHKYTNLPICLIGFDIHMPCTVYEMFSQLHDFYSRLDSNNNHIFHSNLKNLAQNEMKNIERPHIKARKDRQDVIENIKEQKLREVMRAIDPSLESKIETLFNELSQKILDSINKKT